jgi:hypothetical protein
MVTETTIRTIFFRHNKGSKVYTLTLLERGETQMEIRHFGPLNKAGQVMVRVFSDVGKWRYSAKQILSTRYTHGYLLTDDNTVALTEPVAVMDMVAKSFPVPHRPKIRLALAELLALTAEQPPDQPDQEVVDTDTGTQETPAAAPVQRSPLWGTW